MSLRSREALAGLQPQHSSEAAPCLSINTDYLFFMQLCFHNCPPEQNSPSHRKKNRNPVYKIHTRKYRHFFTKSKPKCGNPGAASTAVRVQRQRAAAVRRQSKQRLSLGRRLVQFNRRLRASQLILMTSSIPPHTLLLALLVLLPTTNFLMHAASDPLEVRVFDRKNQPLADGRTISCEDDQTFLVAVAVVQRPPPASKWHVTASVNQSGISCPPPPLLHSLVERNSDLISYLANLTRVKRSKRVWYFGSAFSKCALMKSDPCCPSCTTTLRAS
jgi:hypothetical protein